MWKGILLLLTLTVLGIIALPAMKSVSKVSDSEEDALLFPSLIPREEHIQCRYEGPKQHPKNSSEYIFCLKLPLSKRWTYYVFSCPAGSTFDDYSLGCIFDDPFDQPESPCDSRNQKQLGDEDDAGIICP